MFCHNCGKKISDDSFFCEYCGVKLASGNVYDRVGELAYLMKSGDNSAFNELYELTKKMVRFELISAGVPDASLDDMMQEVYIKVCTKISKLNDVQSAWKWIKIIAYKSGIDFAKKSVNLHETVISASDDQGTDIFETDETLLGDPLPMPEDIMENAASQRLMRDIIKSLPQRQYLMVVAFYYNESSIKEIAFQLGVSESVVKTELFRARKSIRQQVEATEKKHGIRLHSIAPFTVLGMLFASEVDAAEVPLFVDVQIKSYAFISNAFNPTISYSAAQAASATASASASATTKAMGIGTKAVIGLLTATAIGGGAFGVYKVTSTNDTVYVEESDGDTEEKSSSPEESVDLAEDERMKDVYGMIRNYIATDMSFNLSGDNPDQDFEVTSEDAAGIVALGAVNNFVTANGGDFAGSDIIDIEDRAEDGQFARVNINALKKKCKAIFNVDVDPARDMKNNNYFRSENDKYYVQIGEWGDAQPAYEYYKTEDYGEGYVSVELQSYWHVWEEDDEHDEPDGYIELILKPNSDSEYGYNVVTIYKH